MSRTLARLGVMATWLMPVACAAGPRVPPALRGYEILVERRDSLGGELAAALKAQGLRVRRRIRGGSRPVAAVLQFTYREAGTAGPTWFHVRLADTRTGIIVAAASIRLDSVPASGRARARAAAQALTAQAPVPVPSP